MNQTQCNSKSRKILLIAYHVPPIQGGSGVHRMLSYARFLSRSGWDVKILSVTPNAYPCANLDNLSTLPQNVEVIRAATLDSQRHLSIGGRYLRFLALPDRWQSWIFSGTWRGIWLFRRWRPDVIMSTFPISSAHVIGLGLHKLFNVPWIADFRDPMASDDYPADIWVRRCYWWIEKRVFRYAQQVTVTTQGTKDYYIKRYGKELADRIAVIPNGYDENLFPEQKNPPICTGRPLRILHSGLVYSVERNPTAFFQALAELKSEGQIDSSQVCFVFRSSSYSAEYQERFSHLQLDGLVIFEDESLPYKVAIQEMVDADALLVLQASICNMQIPAKVYEYLATGRPVLALTDPTGDTAQLLRDVGSDDIMRLDDKLDIKQKLPEFLSQLKYSAIKIPDRDVVINLSRGARTKELAALLEKIVSAEC
jgi:glycosyltransferase involved in cell wall biosynthesis